MNAGLTGYLSRETVAGEVFEVSGAFECAKLQCFDIYLCQAHPFSSSSYREIEQKTAGQDLSIVLGERLEDTLYVVCWSTTYPKELVFSRAFPAIL